MLTEFNFFVWVEDNPVPVHIKMHKATKQEAYSELESKPEFLGKKCSHQMFGPCLRYNSTVPDAHSEWH